MALLDDYMHPLDKTESILCRGTSSGDGAIGGEIEGLGARFAKVTRIGALGRDRKGISLETLDEEIQFVVVVSILLFKGTGLVFGWH
jgi:hypothetical protein